MRRRHCHHDYFTTVVLLLAGISTLVIFGRQEMAMAAEPPSRVIELPGPASEGSVPLERTLAQRRSVRSYRQVPMTLEEVRQLLWAAQGISSDRGYRTAPSAGATYPLEMYVSVGDVDDLAPGIYRYRPREHDLVALIDGDRRDALTRASLGQGAIQKAPAVFIVTAIYARTTGRYGDRGIRYVHMEAGHAAQNLCLQAVARGLGTVVIGAFHDREIRAVLGLGKEETPLYVIPVGK